MKKTSLIILFLSLINLLHADTESAMRSSGKIYVVVGIILIIFLWIVIYLFRLDRKLSKIERKNK